MLLGCGSGRVDEIQAELQQLGKERIALDEVEKVRAEADAAEAALAELRAASADGAAREQASVVRRDARARALEAARIDVETQRAALDGLRAEIARERAEAQALDLEIAKRRDAARPLRDRAAALERELRPEDPAWATERRLLVLNELARNIATAYPGDPVLQQLAAETGVEAARERARVLRDRLAWVYDLERESPSGDATR